MDELDAAINAAIADRIRARREALGLSRRAIASRAGMHITNYRRIESGSVGLTFRTLASIADALELAPADLVAGLHPRDLTPRPFYTARDLTGLIEERKRAARADET